MEYLKKMQIVALRDEPLFKKEEEIFSADFSNYTIPCKLNSKILSDINTVSIIINNSVKINLEITKDLNFL